MTVIAAIDNRNGMLFNGRRQSKDEELRKRVLALAREHLLWVNEYSAKQFREESEILTVNNAFLELAGEEDFCFAETEPLLPYLDKIDRLILYRWNRDYPGDSFLDLPYEDWEMVSFCEFVGKSHEKITEEIYEVRRSLCTVPQKR